MPQRESGAFRTLDALESAAERAIAPDVWAYIQGGAGEERTVRANRAAFERATIRPGPLRGISEVDLRTRLLGSEVAAPVFVAPMAYHGRVHPEGEAATARAAAATGLLAVFGTLSSRSLAEIGSASGAGARWFQLYPQPDVSVERRLLSDAARAGFTAVVLTVDTPVLGVRDRQSRAGFAIDASVPVGTGPGVVPPARSMIRDGGVYRVGPSGILDGSTIDRVRAAGRLPVVVKGIMGADDARRAIDRGAAAVIVSNHGGRQLDGAPAALDVLPEVVAAVGDRAEVYVDGGVRRGSDVAVALGAGATAVGVGRPVLWALGAGGSAGVERYFELLLGELATSLLLAGRATAAPPAGESPRQSRSASHRTRAARRPARS